MDDEHEAFGLDLWDLPERFQRFDQALRYVRAAIGPQPADYSGTYYQLHADVQPGPTGPLPLIVGGTGKKRTPALAGRYADEYNQSPRDPAVLARNIRTMRDAAEKAGRDPGSIVASIMGSVLVGSDEASYRERLETAAAARKESAAELEERFAAGGLPIGTPDRARATMAAWEEAGVDRFYVRHMELDDLDLLDEKLAAVGG